MYIDSSIFGDIFSDLSWLTPLYFFFVGLITGAVWKSFCAGRVIGVVLYPWLGFAICLWFGDNNFLDTKMFIVLFAVACLWMYEKLLVSSSPVLEGQKSPQIVG
jgi:hypothetical protein